MLRRMGTFLGLGVVVLLVGVSCIDESPTRSGPAPVYFALNPGTQWTYQYVIDDSARYWSTQLRDDPTVVLGNAVWAMDYYADGAITETVYFVQEGGAIYLAGERAVSWEDTLVDVFAPSLLFCPGGRGPGETWSSVATVTHLKITPAVPSPETLVTEGYFTWTGRVLREERIQVPAFDEPVNTLLVEYYGEADPWTPPEHHTYFWYAENIGPVRTIDLTFVGRTENNLSDFVQGK